MCEFVGQENPRKPFDGTSPRKARSQDKISAVRSYAIDHQKQKLERSQKVIQRVSILENCAISWSQQRSPDYTHIYPIS